MTYNPIAFIAPNYRDYKNYWLKAYEPGTTTPKSMSLDSGGTVTVAKLQLNADGFLVSAGGALVIPYIDGSYDLWLFPTEAEADANDTSEAERLADDVNSLNTSNINNLSLHYVFDTLADMVASTIVFPVGKRIEWQGYYDQSDGGSNWGIVKSGAHTDDGGSILTLADGKYVKANLKGNKVSVLKFGAKGDANFKNGSGDWFVDAGFTTPATDDTAAFQATCDFAYNIYVPTQVTSSGYLISGLHVGKRKNIYGDSNRSSRITYTNTANTCITLDSSSTLHHLYFLGSDNSTGIAIGFEDEANSTDISNLQIRDIGVGISGVAPTGRPVWGISMSYVRIDNCTRGFDFSNSEFGDMQGHTTLRFYGCFVGFCTNGFRINASSSVSIVSCSVDSCSSDAIYMYATSGAEILDFRMELNAGKQGINLERCVGVTIDGIELDANQNSDLTTSWMVLKIETFGKNITLNNVYARRHYVTSGILNSLWGCSADCTLDNSFMYVGSSEGIINTLKTSPGNVKIIHANNGGLVVGGMAVNFPNLTGSKGIASPDNMDIGGQVWLQGVYDNNTGGAANVFVNTDGRLSRTASSRKYKENERDILIDTANVFNLKPSLFDFKDTESRAGDKDCTGYIAEDAGEFASLDMNGEPDGINWNLITISLVEELKALKKDFEDYKLSH